MEAATDRSDTDSFAFDPASLDTPRAPGISALLRVRNGADYLRETIESHLPFYDEIVACWNNSTDGTERILAELAREHPGRVRPFHYLPTVHPPLSTAHDATPTGSVHGLANYYNFALARARHSVVTKLDDDHLALPAALGACVARIRADLARGVRMLYTFSGLNLVRDPVHGLAVYDTEPFVGSGDHLYFPVCRAIHWRQAPGCEQLDYARAGLRKRYQGLTYLHLKHLKPDFGFGNLDPETRREQERRFAQTFRALPFEQFRTARHRKELCRRHGWLDYCVRANSGVQWAIRAVSGRDAPLRIRRLQRLPADLAALDWQRDVVARLSACPAYAAVAHSPCLPTSVGEAHPAVGGDHSTRRQTATSAVGHRVTGRGYHRGDRA